MTQSDDGETDYSKYGEAFVRALKNTEGQPLHNYLKEVVMALSSERARWMFALKEDSDNPPMPD